jgi:hypothetical protein
MPAYLVRVRSDQPAAAGEIVGIFVADGLPTLRHLVDAVISPWGCEYKTLGNGAIVWETAGSPVVPIPVPDAEDDKPFLGLFDGASVLEDWNEEIWDSGRGTKPWKPLADEWWPFSVHRMIAERNGGTKNEPDASRQS